MFRHKNTFIFIVTLSIACGISCAYNQGSPFVKILRNTLVSTARSCMKPFNATDADLERLKKEPPYPEKSSCVVMCILEKIGIVKDKNYSKIGFMNAVAPLVSTNKKKLEHMKVVSENCDKEVNVKPRDSECQLGSDIVECTYKYAPELRIVHN